MTKKYIKKLLLRISILGEFFKTLWKYKLWWGIPIILVILVFTIVLIIAGHTGIAAFIYPLF